MFIIKKGILGLGVLMMAIQFSGCYVDVDHHYHPWWYRHHHHEDEDFDHR